MRDFNIYYSVGGERLCDVIRATTATRAVASLVARFSRREVMTFKLERISLQ